MGDPRDEPTAYSHEPYSIDLEQAILGICLRDNAQIDIAAADLTSQDFYDPLHARMFDMLLALMGDGDAVTPLILHSVMKSDPGIIETQGLVYLTSLYQAAPAIPTMRTWIKGMKDLALRRQLLKISQALAESATAPPSEMTARQSAEAATEALLAAGRDTARPILTIREIAAESILEAEGLKQGKSLPIVRTGFEKLDDEIGGLRGGDLCIIMGKSGSGKSALMGGVSRYTAQNGIPTIVFSLEMMRRQWIERMVCDLDFDTAAKPMWYSRVRNGRLSDDEFSRFVLASQQTDGWPFEIHDDDDLTASQISARARAFAAKHRDKMGLVVIDYLQIVQPADDKENRERQVARIARALKSLGKRLGWPVIAGSQMNESDAQRAKEEKRPQASDARESRGIMNEADLMLAPWRPAYFVERRKPMDTPDDSPAMKAWWGELREVRNKFDLLCLKNRHGRTFDVSLWAEIGSSAVRDQAPMRLRPAEERAADDLLTVMRA